MSDLISRKAAIDALDCINGVEEVLRALPSAQPEVLACGSGELNAHPPQQWIPCSERLPDDEQVVLFSTKTGRVHQGRYHKDNSVNQWYSSLDKMRAWNNVVNAWMPLPEPYKGDE